MESGNRTKIVVALVLLTLASRPALAQADASGARSDPERPTLWSDLSPDVRQLIAGTVLQRDLPAPTEPPEVIRRYLRLGALESLDADSYVKLMRRTAERWPESRLAHAGLADALRDAHDGTRLPKSYEKRPCTC